jgi:hypothetical protein
MNCKNSGNRVPLSAKVLESLPQFTVADLKTYIFLCSRDTANSGAQISEIELATGLKRRAVMYALKRLCKDNLIVRADTNGNRFSEYSLALQAVEPESKIAQATSEVASTAKEPTTGFQKDVSLQNTIAALYRPLTEAEFIELKSHFPDEATFRKEVDLFVERERYGVMPDLAIAFLAGLIRKTATR